MNDFLRRLLYLPEQASTVSKDIDWLHFFVIITTMLGALVVGACCIYFAVRYREGANHGKDVAPDPRPLHSRGGVPLWIEGGVFTGLLGLFVLWWVIGFRQFVDVSEPPPDSMTIYVTGKQWMWSFAYPNGTGSNGVLYVPAGRPVKLVLTSRDVIHSFYVPAFRLKRDAVPGRTTTMWFEVKHPGHYPVYCAEYCGAEHSMMRAEVVALPSAEYEQALERLDRVAIAPQADPDVPVVGASAPSAPLSLAAIGQQVAADAGCFRCHTPDGTPHIGPTWAGLFEARIPLDDGRTIVADEAYLTRSMMDPAAELHRGYAAVMPSYQGLLTAPQVGAIVEYIRTLRGVSRFEGSMPLPQAVPHDVPLVHPLPAAGASR